MSGPSNTNTNTEKRSRKSATAKSECVVIENVEMGTAGNTEDFLR